MISSIYFRVLVGVLPVLAFSPVSHGQMVVSAPSNVVAEAGVQTLLTSGSTRILLAIRTPGLATGSLSIPRPGTVSDLERNMIEGWRFLLASGSIGVDPTGQVGSAQLHFTPITYEVLRGRDADFSIQLLPVRYQRELGMALDHHLAVYPIGLTLGDSESGMASGRINRGNPGDSEDVASICRVSIRALGAAYRRMSNSAIAREGGGIAVGGLDFVLGGTHRFANPATSFTWTLNLQADISAIGNPQAGEHFSWAAVGQAFLNLELAHALTSDVFIGGFLRVGARMATLSPSRGDSFDGIVQGAPWAEAGLQGRF